MTTNNNSSSSALTISNTVPMNNMKLNIFNNNKDEIVTLLSSKLTDEQQKLFVLSFSEFLKHRSDEFVVDVDKVWKELGYSTKQKLTMIPEKDFKENEHYVYVEILLAQKGKQDSCEKWGGSNKQTILLTIDCAMEMCLIVNTPRGKQVRHYYMKIEKIKF